MDTLNPDGPTGPLPVITGIPGQPLTLGCVLDINDIVAMLESIVATPPGARLMPSINPCNETRLAESRDVASQFMRINHIDP